MLKDSFIFLSLSSPMYSFNLKHHCNCKPKRIQLRNIKTLQKTDPYRFSGIKIHTSLQLTLKENR